MKALPILSLLAFLFLTIFLHSSEGHFLSLNDRNHSMLGWHFPKDRPYHYFNSTADIPSTFLPVKVSFLPQGHGLWVLRHKDFNGEPKVFNNDHKDTSKSIITYETESQLFDSVTVKALAYGDAELKLNFGNEAREKISLFEYNQICTIKNTTTNDTKHKDETTKGLKWIIYQVQTSHTSHMSLEAFIPHQKSFIILDEVLIYFNHNAKNKKTADDDDNEKSADGSGGNGLHEDFKVYCKVAE